MTSGGALRRPSRPRRPDRNDLAVVVGLTVLVCLPVWPGIYTIDSQAILRAARADQISDWYAPVLGWLWGGVDELGVPIGAVFAATVAGFVAAVLGLVSQLVRPAAARAVTALVVVYPPIYGLLGWMGRDVWFASSSVAITALALHIHRSRHPSALALAGLVTLGVLAADARQNGLPFAALAFGVAAAGLTRRLGPARSARARAAVIGVAIVAGAGVLVIAQRLVVVVDHHPEQILLVRDLTAVTLDRGAPAMDGFLFPTQDVAALRSALDGHDPDGVIGLEPPLVRYVPFEDQPDAAETNDAFRDQWWTMLRDHPVPYLRTRIELFLLQAGISRDVRTPYFGRSDTVVGVEGVDDAANSFPVLLDVRNAYLSWTDGPRSTGSILHAPVLYMIAAVGSIWAIGRRTGERAAAWLLIGVLAAMQVLLFVTAPTGEYRFQFFQVVFGTLFLAVLVVHEVWPREATVRAGLRRAPLSRLGRS